MKSTSESMGESGGGVANKAMKITLHSLRQEATEYEACRITEPEFTV